MMNRLQKAAARQPLRSGRRVERGEFWLLLAELKSLGERGSGALADAYALAASSVLRRLERLEDLNAERSYRQRSKSAASHQGSV
jgi:hypothetical protein